MVRRSALGKSGMTRDRGSSSDSFPSWTSNRMPAAVNCLLTEPIRQTVAGVIGVAVSISARPNPRENATAPRRRTQIWRPGTRRSATILLAKASAGAHRLAGLAADRLGAASNAARPAIDSRRLRIMSARP